MAVRGFGVKLQQRTRVRKPIDGEYEGFKFTVNYNKGKEILCWYQKEGTAQGQGVTLEDCLRQIRAHVMESRGEKVRKDDMLAIKEVELHQVHSAAKKTAAVAKAANKVVPVPTAQASSLPSAGGVMECILRELRIISSVLLRMAPEEVVEEQIEEPAEEQIEEPAEEQASSEEASPQVEGDKVEEAPAPTEQPVVAAPEI